MAEAQVIEVPLQQIGTRRKVRASIAVIGNPNSGKSTLFNRLTGLRQSTGNYPGVTVEKHVGTLQLEKSAIELIDLPGIYGLAGESADEQIAVDVLLGRVLATERPAGLLFVLDATHLYQGLYLLEQLLELRLPTIVALTLTDQARANGIAIDKALLEKKLGGIPICEVISTTGFGVDSLKATLARLPALGTPQGSNSWVELSEAVERLAVEALGALPRTDVLQGLLHPGSDLEGLLTQHIGEDRLHEVRRHLFADQHPQAAQARKRYRWVAGVLEEVVSQAPLVARIGARARRWIDRPWPATLAFFVVMALVFQAVFSWAIPLMDAIDAGAAMLGRNVVVTFGNGMLGSFLADGVIAGVGSVVVFLPQILILFTFIIVLEDSGYLARAAFLMDRVMRSVGLSGQSVIPMLSSFACAVPAIMATRVIPDRRDRIATILAAPFMTCSARLPIYALLIAAFVPQRAVGWFNLQGLVLLGLYVLGIAGGLFTARLLKSTRLRGPNAAFTLALPEFRRPNLRTVAIKLMDRVRVFLKRAGTLILTVAIVVWVLAYFPRTEPVPASSSADTAEEMSSSERHELENQAAAEQLSNSWLGRIGKSIEPVFEPLGWDWRVSSAVIAGFPAREVVVAVLGTLYAVGSDSGEIRIAEQLRAARWPNGAPVFTLPMVLGMLVFYAWCLQCAATVATIRRETNSWSWPAFAWIYMTVLGYVGALLIFQLGSRL